jgi:hypothetical protein
MIDIENPGAGDAGEVGNTEKVVPLFPSAEPTRQAIKIGRSKLVLDDAELADALANVECIMMILDRMGDEISYAADGIAEKFMKVHRHTTDLRIKLANALMLLRAGRRS